MTETASAAEHRWRRAFLLLFVVSGFSGLIYQSIWTHYLKLFLGHAAFAQTLVLMIFMGGLAIGSWLASRVTPRLRHPLLAYALIEALIGLGALGFHLLFVWSTAWSQEQVFPALGAAMWVDAWKWVLSGVLILPLSVLLGTTFPLISAALARRAGREPGRVIAGLYFANSLGAAIGVLVAGFVLIAWVGLPGTLLTAGLLNIAIALCVYVAVRVRHGSSEPAPAVKGSAAERDPRLVRRLLLVSMLTGTASFVYEIGWIRMLSMVLGSSTHAFELMLSAFITGLAIGGFWIRRHVDHLRDPQRALGVVQVLMGLLAAGTIAAYGSSFDLMRFVMLGLRATPEGYVLFNLASHSLALAVMLPATICAGMTLPIISHLLLVRGGGEEAIGRVYAVNTAGAIVGVLLAVLWLMPGVGLAWMILLAALLDVLLGVWLLAAGARRGALREGALAAGLALMLLPTIHWGSDWDRKRMASGVFLKGDLLAAEDEVLFHHDGRTATIDVVRQSDVVSIRTNGKPDAGLAPAPDAVSDDEYTMVLLAALPLMSVPHATDVAVIGLGSGMSTHTLLAHPGLRRVDTVEIEQGMLDGARTLGPKVARAFTDPRSHIHIADARTFLTSEQKRYDLIVSEPSNSWVSGVAGLFSVEFYQTARRHLAEGGVLAQWFHIYQVDVPLVASVAKALGEAFPHYRLHLTSNGDALFLASQEPIAAPSYGAIAHGLMKQELERIGMRGQADVDWTRAGDSEQLRALFAEYPLPANSDFFPVLDQNAVRTRFLQSDALELQELGAGALFGLNPAPSWPARGVNPDHPLRLAQQAARAEDLFAYWSAADAPDRSAPQEIVAAVELARGLLGRDGSCDAWRIEALAMPAAVSIAIEWGSLVPPQLQRDLWLDLRDSACASVLRPAQRSWLALLAGASEGDDRAVIASGLALLPASGPIADTPQGRLLLRYLMQALLRQDDAGAVLALWQRFDGKDSNSLPLRALAALARSRLAGAAPAS